MSGLQPPFQALYIYFVLSKPCIAFNLLCVLLASTGNEKKTTKLSQTKFEAELCCFLWVYFLLIFFMVSVFSPQPSSLGTAAPMDLTYTVERRQTSEVKSRTGDRLNTTTDERYFRGSLESLATTSTPRPLLSEEEFVSSLRSSSGSTSTPFVTALSEQGSLGAAPRLSNRTPGVLAATAEESDYGTPASPSTSEESLKSSRRYVRAKRRIAFAGLTPAGSRFVLFSLRHFVIFVFCN